MRISVNVRNPFDPSTALDAHIARHLDAAVRPHERHVQRVDLRLSDANGPRRGPADKITLIEIALQPFGAIVTRARDADVYRSVTTATARAKQALARYADRLSRRTRRPRTRAMAP